VLIGNQGTNELKKKACYEITDLGYAFAITSSLDTNDLFVVRQSQIVKIN